MSVVTYCFVALLVNAPPSITHPGTVVVVTGAGGTDEFTEQFIAWSDRWEQAGSLGGLHVLRIDRHDDSSVNDRDRLQRALEELPRNERLWVVFNGHGTFDGRVARLNLHGPDLSAEELKSWLAPFTGPVAIINCASSSGPFVTKLAGPNRVVISATQSGHEMNFARFGEYLSVAITDAAADLDKDGQTSLLEAYLMASRRTEEFYAADGRLTTEHALLEDTGDGRGIRADWFRGLRPVRRSTDGPIDGFRAHQFHLVHSEDERQMSSDTRRRRDELEWAVLQLREKKDQLDETEYFETLETLLVELARLYEEVE